MSNGPLGKFSALGWLAALILAWPAVGSAQVPVDAQGNAIGTTADEIPLLSAAELAELVGPIALYPDDLLAIVLPASTYPLQLVQANRFLKDLKSDATLKPDDDWDDSVVALINYPEVIELLTDDLDKTWRLGEAVVAQQADVIDAVESFRDRAYAAGNLQSDQRQTVSQTDGVIEITPVADDVIYVPYYEPERVVVYQPRPVYYYYPRPYPVYYYPYSSGYAFNHGFFWGVTTAFTVGWFTDSLHVYHHSYHGHPYYGRSYRSRYWYRSRDIHVHNNYYYNNHSSNRHRHGDYWRPHSRSTINHRDQRVTRSRHYPGSGPSSAAISSSSRSSNNSRSRSSNDRQQPRRSRTTQPTVNKQADIKFRQRNTLKPTQIDPRQARKTTTVASRSGATKKPQQEITFRKRSASKPVASNPRSSTSRTTQPRSSSKPQQVASLRHGQTNSRHTSRSSQPKSTQPRVSQFQPKTTQSRTHQSRVSQPKASARRSNQPSRSSQPSRSQKSQKSKSGSSGSNKVANSSQGKQRNSSRDRR